VEGEFLGEYGMYSISKKDKVHWDRIDGDWGGGGSYLGTPLRTARYLYQHGDAARGWDILKRMCRLAKHFAYLPQSPYADEPDEFRTGGGLEVCAGAGLEAIWFGIFGISLREDGSMTISPAPYNPEIGTAILADFRFRGRSFEIRLHLTEYEVLADGKPLANRAYGQMVVVPAPGKASPAP
jgi:hypothetical protein